MPGRDRRGRDGFTLIEVLAALTILAVVLAAGYRVLADGLGGLTRAESRAGALAIAEAQIAALGTERRLEAGRWAGAGDGFRWTLTVSPRTDPPFDRARERGMEAFRVEVTVVDERGAALTLATTRVVGAS